MRVWIGLWIVLACSAQERVGGIQGTVADPSGAPVQGAAVEVAGQTLPRPLRTLTGGAGAYLLPSLPPGDYAVTVTAAGFSAFEWTAVHVDVGVVVRLDANLQIAGLEQSVTVNAAVPQVDTAQTLNADVVSASTYSRLPNYRNVDSLIPLAPGVLADSKAGGYQIDGASGAENVFVVDGVEASSILDGTLGYGARVPIEWIAELQVKRGGLDSQFGGAIGGVVNAVTRSGGNEFHGQVSIYFQSDALNAGPRPWLVLSPFNNNQAGYFHPSRDGFTGLNPGFRLGGYLIKNRLWFFSSAYPEFSSFERTVTFLSSGSPTATYRAKTRQDYTLNRIDGQPIDRLRANLAYFYNPLKQQGTLPSPDGTDPISAAWQDRGFRAQALGVTYQADYVAGSGTLFSLFGGYMYGNYKDYGVPQGTYYYFADSNQQVVAPSGSLLPVPASLIGPAGSFTPPSQQTLWNMTLRYNVNALAGRMVEWHGQHELRAGYTLNRLSNDTLGNSFPNGLVILCWSCSYSSVSVPQRTRGVYGYYLNRIIEMSGQAASNNHGMFLQDSWRLRRNLQLSLGVRAERESVPSFHVPDAAASPAIRFPFSSKVAPRLGASWDPAGRGRTRIYGSFGLYYDVMKYSLPRGSFGGQKYKDFVYALDSPDFFAIRPGAAPNSAQGAFPGTLIDVQDYAPPASDPQDVRIDPALKPMRQRAYAAGVDYSPAEGVLAGFRYTRKRLDRAVEDMGIYSSAGEKLYIVNPGEGISVDPSRFPAGYPVPSYSKPVRNYDGLEFSLQAARRSYDIHASYTYSRLYGNYSGLVSSDEGGRVTPNTTRSFDEAWMQFDADGMRVLGLLPTDRPHTFKFAGAWSAHSRRGTTHFGAVLSAMSGAPATTEVELVGPGLVSYVNGRGDMGRTPFLSRADVVLAHEFPIGSAEKRYVRLECSVMNLFNQATVTSLFARYNHPNDGPIAFASLADTMRGFDYKAMMAQQGIRVDPRFGQPNGFLAPRTMRLGLHFFF
jgi:hypothetical protein